MMSMNDQSEVSSILIATDGSVYADAATECGAWLAAHIDAQVTAIYVIDALRLAGHFIKHFSEVVVASSRARASLNRKGVLEITMKAPRREDIGRQLQIQDATRVAAKQGQAKAAAGGAR